MPAASVASAPVHRTSNKTAASRTKKPAAKNAQAVNGAANGAGYASPYGIMASRIANRVAEMAENYTFVEREKYVPAVVPNHERMLTTAGPVSSHRTRSPRRQSRSPRGNSK
jgi:F420-dependent methylenetetrahydromethanopterin dehydrogenase